MAFIPVPNGVQLCFDFLTDAQKWQFCLTLRKQTGAPTPTDLATVAAAGHDWWTNSLRSNINQSTTLVDVRATDITAQGAPQYIEAVGTAGADTSVSPLPLNAALCISERTAKRGRSYRGRVYVSGLTKGMTTSPNLISSTYVTAFGTNFVNLQAALDLLTFDVVVPTRQHNGAAVNPAETNKVIAWVIDTAIDSQRRRLTGRGT